MRPSTALLTFCYLVPLVVVSPLDVYKSNSISIPLSRISRDTTIEDVKAHLTTVSHKYDVTLRNYALSTDLPHSLSNRGPPYKLGERSTGSLTGDGNSVPLVNLWYGSIAVGEPPESFTDLFLCSVRCDLSCAGRRRYNATSSTTSLDLITPFVVKYGNRTEMSGDEYTGVVELAGYRAINQTLGATDTYYSDFAASNAPDRLAGFAFQEILHTSKGYWEIQLGGLSRNGEDMIVSTDKAQAIVDTGTAFIVTKPDNAVKYYENIKGARAVDEIWTVPCNTIGLFEPTLTFGERLFPVSSSTFNLGPVHEGSTDCVAGLTDMPGMGGRFRKAEIVKGSMYGLQLEDSSLVDGRM
ncbi:aspartic peptidase domain-containing protein [Suillus subluteus]|nr:aspartic peptidase domain-containing protein [Suillus subluteus]